MLTVRQIEKLWQGKMYVQLSLELLSARPERAAVMAGQLTLPAATAALAVIRLDELSQSFVPLCSKLIKVILNLQDADGGWGEASTTALCLRALLCGKGDGQAIQRGMNYLTHLQKSDGLWPDVPIRRLAADPRVSAFVLFQLADQPIFRESVRVDDAVEWFETHEPSLDDATRQLWDLIRARRGRVPTPRRHEVMLWS